MSEKEAVHRNSHIIPLNGDDGQLRVGGQLTRATIKSKENQLSLVPGTRYIAKLLVGYYHIIKIHQT